MKGCLAFVGALVVLAILLGGGCVGYAVYQTKQLAERSDAGKHQLDAVDAKYPFVPTTDARLETSRFELFVKIRGELVARVQKAFDDLNAVAQNKDAGAWQMIKNAIGAVKGIANTVADAPAQLAAVLDREKMSFQEYRWSTSRLHGTLIAAAEAGNAEAKELNDLFERSLQKLNDPNSNANAEKLHAELGAAYATADPQELALILSNREALKPESPGYIIDVIVISELKKDDASK